MTRRHHVGASLGIGSYGRDGQLLVGLDSAFGWGNRLAVNLYQQPPSLTPTSHDDLTITLVIAGSTSVRTLNRAFEDVKALVTTP